MGNSIDSIAEPNTATPAIGSFLLPRAQRAAALPYRLWAAYWDYQLRRATILMLRALDDRTLADIGLASSEIEPTVSAGGMAPAEPFGPA